MGKRLMYGTDGIVWPVAFAMAIRNIETAAFLSEEEKADIFYNNAALFLRLSKPAKAS